MASIGLGEHRRINDGWLAAGEKRLLIALAARLPAGVLPDHLTALGFLGMVLAAAAVWGSRYRPWLLALAVVGLALNWLGDSLDGTLARVRNRLRPRYGFYVDHVLDCFGAAFLIAGLALSGRMSPAVAGTFLTVYLLVNAEIFLATHVLGVFRMSSGPMGPTELRVLLAIGLLRSWPAPTVTLAGVEHLLFDVGGVAGAVVLALVLGVNALRNTRQLAAEEPVR